MSTSELSEGREIMEFAALASIVVAHLGGGRVLTTDGHEPLSPHIAGDLAETSYPDAQQMFDAAVRANETCLIVPPWGIAPGRDVPEWPDPGSFSRPFGVVVPAGELRYRLPRHVAAHGGPTVVLDAACEVAGVVQRGFRLALVIIDPAPTEPAITRFFKAPENRRSEVAALATELGRLLEQPGGTTPHGFIYRGASLAGKSLRYEDHDPLIRAKIEDLGGFGTGAVVSNVFDVILPRPMNRDRIGSAEEIDPSVRIVRGRDLTPSGELLPVDVDAEEQGRRPRFGVTLRAGDLLMREIERPGRACMPVEITDVDLPLAAGPNLLVLRPQTDLDREELEFYRLYLGSQQSRVVMRASRMGGDLLRISGLRQAPLPRPDADLLDALRDIRRAQESLRSWADEGIGLTSEAFQNSAAVARRRLIETGRELRQRVEAAEQVGSRDHRIANFYPYPVAHKWRLFRVAEGAGDNAHTYTTILDCFEATLAFGAAIALTCAYVNGLEVPAMREVSRKLAGSGAGTSLGDWVNILKNVSSGRTFRNLDADAPLASIRQLLADGSEIAHAQERLSKRRNDESHQRRVDPIDFPGAIEAARADLELILDGAAFFADLPIYQIKSTRWDSLQRRGQAVAQVLRGDHPVARSVTIEHTDAGIESDSLYVKDVSGALVLLRPFLIRHECPQCRTWSTFHPDRREGGELRLKAVDHSHTISGAGFETALRLVGYIAE